MTRAGGFTDKAYLLGGVLIRESTRVLQKQQLNAAIDRLEARVLATAGEKAASGTDAEDAKRAEAASKQQQMLIAALRKVEPLGRVVIQLEDPERLRGTPNDITLQEGDRLMVPQAPGTVNVVGAVFAPTALVYTPYRTVKEYLTMAGGTTEIADDKEIYVIKANGAAVSRKGFSWLRASWDGTKYGYHPGGISSLTLDPGDTIVVPEKLERIAWLKNIKDIATILGNIALTAGIALCGPKVRWLGGDQRYRHHSRPVRLDDRRGLRSPQMNCEGGKMRLMAVSLIIITFLGVWGAKQPALARIDATGLTGKNGFLTGPDRIFWITTFASSTISAAAIAYYAYKNSPAQRAKGYPEELGPGEWYLALYTGLSYLPSADWKFANNFPPLYQRLLDSP